MIITLLSDLPLHQQIQLAIYTSIFSLILSIVLAIKNHSNNKKIEVLKSDLDQQKTYNTEYFRNYLHLWVEGNETEINSYKEILNSIQLLRDKMKSVIEYPRGISPKKISAEVADLAQGIVPAYAKNQMNF